MEALDATSLEAMVDKHGLHHVLTALECICSEKAEHLRANWQDAKSARPWDMFSKRFGALARDAAERLP